MTMALLGLSGLFGLAAIACLGWNLWGTLRGPAADRAGEWCGEQEMSESRIPSEVCRGALAILAGVDAPLPSVWRGWDL